MGARKLVGRVRRLIGGAFFYDRKTGQESGAFLKLIRLKAPFLSWIVVVA
jgi:hypothetical protein